MKHNSEHAKYTKLKIKMLLQILALIAGAFIALFLAYAFIWAGRGADFIVKVFQILLSTNYERALYLYNTLIRNNAEILLFCAIVVIFIVVLYFSLSRFIRYFNEINKGIDALVLEDGWGIRLSPELEPIENKLNTVCQNLRQRAADARLAEQRKNDLVMYLAHDIRTPLTSVIGYLSLLDEVPDMPAEQKAKYVHITLEKAIRLETLVNEFFEITRYNLQQITLQQEDIDLYYMLTQLIDEFYPILSAKGSTARLLANENLTAFGDPAELARVFNNLLKNAESYSTPGSEILITAAENTESVDISFQNQGKTIPAEKLSQIFEKFYRLDESRASNTGGAGLGLFIARQIVEAHGGSISAQSENGITTFTVHLPKKSPQIVAIE